MVRLYADEQFPRKSTEHLQEWDHDVLTVQEAAQDNQAIPDDEVLAFATTEKRAVMTLNRRDFIQPASAEYEACWKRRWQGVGSG